MLTALGCSWTSLPSTGALEVKAEGLSSALQRRLLEHHAFFFCSGFVLFLVSAQTTEPHWEAEAMATVS